jgi:hypothetical protein
MSTLRDDVGVQFDRAAAGLSGAAILVVLAFAPGGVAAMTVVLLTGAGLVVLATFAPHLPLLHRLPAVGAPRVTVVITSEPVEHVPGDVVLRVGFRNDGPRRVESVLLNVLVPKFVAIQPSDHTGDYQLRGSPMPDTEVDGRPMRFWAEKDVNLPRGSTLLHYRLSIPEAGECPVRVTYSSDDLYGRNDHVADGSVSRPRDPSPARP